MTTRRTPRVPTPRRRRGSVSVRVMALVSLAATLMATPPAGAETLTLEAAVARARRENPALEASRARHEEARAMGREARLARLPSVELSETGLRTTSPADVFGLQLMQERFSFPAFTSRDPNAPDPLTHFSTEIEARLPLFTGGALGAGIQQAERMAQAAGAVTEHTAFAVELGVTRAYLGTLLAREAVALADRARETTARHVGRAQDFFDAGMMVESDLLHARVQLATMDEAVIRARHGARLAEVALHHAMGEVEDRPLELVTPAAAVDSLLPGEAEAVTLAAADRNDLRAVRSQVAAAEAGIGRARADYWPRVGVAARYAWNDDTPFGGHGDSYTVAAMLQWTVWNWGQTAARVSRSRSAHAAALEEQRSYEQQVTFEVRRARQGVDEARARVAVAGGGVAAAERAVTIVDDRFGQGIARMTDLLDAETRAHEARLRALEARFDLEIAIRTLWFAIGRSPVMEVSR